MRTTLSVILAFACPFIFAQTPVFQNSTGTNTTTLTLPKRCSSHEHLLQQQQADPSLKARMEQIEQFTQNYLQNPGAGSRAVITIPVVFHVVYNTTAENIADSFCVAQINQLNLDYARLNADAANTPSAFASLAANTNVQFCLAVRDPNGNATTGIIHKYTTRTSFSDNDYVKTAANGGDDAWPVASYLNIWTCDLGSGLLGYAQFPGGTAATDGVVVDYTSVGSALVKNSGSPYDMGRTATHEVGHWLNLYHIWGDDSNCSGSDAVNDTPNQETENYGCPNYPLLDGCATTAPGAMFMNYMDYTDDACMNLFTTGQAARMNALFAAGGQRVAMLASLGCVPIGPVCNLATGLNTTAVTATSATFTWAAVAGAASYTLQYRPVGSATWTTATTTAASYTINGLTALTNYEWQVKTICSNGGSSIFTGSTTFTTAGPPTVNFKADAVTSCTGLIHFTDLTSGSPTTWQWNFGDGTTSTLQNPVHQYVANGTFTVVLTATNNYGSNAATQTNYIVVNKPVAPAATGASRCGPGTVTLTANTSDAVRWYTSATATAPVSTNATYTTPVLNTTTLFYVEDSVAGVTGTAGPAASNTLGNGGYFNNSTDRYLIFNCLAACTLKTVKVYAQNSGARIIELRDANGTVLQSLTATLATGTNTVTLNFALPVANNLRLAINGTANLYRNNAVNGGYPFQLANYISITGNNAGAGYYYYFYNWQIEAPGCVSLRTPVTATITAGLQTTTSATGASCFGAVNGSAAVNITGGTPAYIYSWSNSGTASSIANVPAGTYTVTVSDATGCSGIGTVTVTEPAAISAVITATNSSCGQANGILTAAATGGAGAFTYSWSNGASTATVNNLAPGNYSVSIADANNCTASASSGIAGGNSLSLTLTPAAAACYGDATGNATLSINGGTPGYTYSWSNGQSGAQLTNVAAGTYTVTVADAGGCSGTQTVTITQPAQPLSATAGIVDATCGQANGSINITAAGGTAGYTYAWSNNSTTATIINLQAGTYTVTVTDSRSCTAALSSTVASSAGLNISATATNVLCNGGNNGAAVLNVTGGTPVYTYSWAGGSTANSISGLAAGTYTVTVNDVTNCSAIAAFTITEPTAIAVNTAASNPLCYAAANGSITLTPSGGTGSYTYTWNTGGNTSSITGLAAGNYSATISDANNCDVVVAASLSAPAALGTQVASANVACFGDADGSIEVTATGGTPGYVYSWSNGSNSALTDNLAPGTYTVTVADQHSCSVTATVTITQPSAALQISTSATVATAGDSNAVATVTNISGGVPPYTVAWSNGETGNAATNLAAGTYTATITDANGCSQTTTVSVQEVTGIAAISDMPELNIYPNPAKEQVTVTGNTDIGAVLSVTNVLGQVLHREELNGNIKTTIQLSTFAAGVYYIELRSNGKVAAKQLVVVK